MMLLLCGVHTETLAAPFVPNSPCNGCTVEIFDHTGVAQTSKNAVFRVSNPQTPNGPAPFLELYNPTLAMIEDCAAKVDSIRKPAPGSVVMNAREYQLSGSNQVVFLIEDCKLDRRAGTKPDRPRLDIRVKQDDPRLDDPRLYDGPLEDSSGEFGGCGSGDLPGPISCADLASNPAAVSGHGWQTVSNTLSEASCQLGYTDAVAGSGQSVIYDNTYSVTCDSGVYEPGVYVGLTPPDSNWGAYVRPSETCKMKTGPRPSDGTGVVEVIVCPVLSDEAPGRIDTTSDRPLFDGELDPRFVDSTVHVSPGRLNIADSPVDDGLTDGSGTEFSGCGSGDMPTSTSCSVSGSGWQSVSNTLSEASCQLGYTDAVAGSGQFVIYDNTYSVTCDSGVYEPGVYVGLTPSDSNWGAYVSASETCQMKTGVHPSTGAHVVERIVCPASAPAPTPAPVSCGSGDMPTSTSCSVSGSGWQSVSNTLSEASCQLGYTDAVAGSGQFVIYDNTYSVTCDSGVYEPGVYVGSTPSDSNWGAYVSASETCQMKTGVHPSTGAHVVERIVCPSP
jgi:hypothetical protein